MWKNLIFPISLILLLPECIQASETEKTLSNDLPNTINLNQKSKSDTIHSTTNHIGMFLDHSMTMKSGVENILLFHYTFTHLEDKVLGTHWTDEASFIKKSTGVLGRFTKYIFADIPISYFLILVNHEFFGHGMRYRELDLGEIEYHLEAPPPYGSGGGYANVLNYTREISDQERIVIWQGGLESHDILNRRLSLRWLADERSYYQENILYLWTWQDRFQYIQTTLEKLPANLNGPLNDPQGYVWFLNRQSGFDNPDNLQLDIAALQKRNLVNLVNPFVWYSLYAQFVKYMYGGRTDVQLPILKFGKLGYLPSLRMSLTPFGPQYHFENYLTWPGRYSLFDIRFGDQTFYQNWWGMG